MNNWHETKPSYYSYRQLVAGNFMVCGVILSFERAMVEHFNDTMTIIENLFGNNLFDYGHKVLWMTFYLSPSIWLIIERHDRLRCQLPPTTSYLLWLII